MTNNSNLARRHRLAIATFAILLAVSTLGFHRSALAQRKNTPPPQEPEIAAASDEAKNAMQVFRLPDSVTATVFSAEPDVANPVAIDVDHLGRVFVCESFRQENGVEDNRNHPEWLRDDLAAKTVADRIAYMKKHLGDKVATYSEQDDRIRLLIDTNGDGVADKSTVFADRFNALEDGTGAGVLATRDGIYFTCIPNLWKLTESEDGTSSKRRKKLQKGFGVRFAFRGHDLHGLIIGPDGRLYFSMGDRGYDVSEITSDPGSGAVFRCELDGTNLEVIATGLRNPQELAFDDYGNLFTGDNNSDSGDKARMVYVVEGSDSGWRMAYQYLSDRGPFNREKIWHPYDPKITPAYIVPPIDNFADGPSGFAHYPGTGFSSEMDGRFLLCDFRGQTSGSGIKTFRLNPKGAFFEIADEENTFWNLLATDCCFGPDGRLYVSDWVHGWDGLGKGRVYAFEDAKADKELVAEVQSLLKEGMTKQSNEQLADLLGHKDRRVRMEAQFEFVLRTNIDPLVEIAKDTQRPELARIHAIWALNQRSREAVAKANLSVDTMLKVRAALTVEASLNAFCELVRNSAGEVRRQAVRMLGPTVVQANTIAKWNENSRTPIDPVDTSSVAGAAKLLADYCLATKDSRLTYFATIALGEVAASDMKAIYQMLDQNAAVDPILRHAGIMTLARYGNLGEAIAHESPHVQIAAVVAARKRLQKTVSFGGETSRSRRTRKSPADILRVALTAPSPSVVLEAARAIHDLPVADALNDLAKTPISAETDDALVRRVLNANFRLGDADSLVRIEHFAVSNDQQVLDERRRDAIQMIRDWTQPDDLDLVLGMYRPLEKEGRAEPTDSAKRLVNSIEKLPSELFDSVLQVAIRYKVESATPVMMRLFNDEDSSAANRLQAFRGLSALESASLPEAKAQALNSDLWQLRVAALKLLHEAKSESLLPEIIKSLAAKDVNECQAACRILGKMDDNPEAVELLKSSFARLDSFPPEAQLDLILATENHSDPEIRALVEKKFPKPTDAKDLAGDPRFQFAKFGGNVERGADIFYNRGDVSCLRCHKIQGSGGDVGPNLSNIGGLKDRDYLLASLLKPSETIAEDFETVVVLDVNGKTHIGVTKSSTDETLSIMTADAIMVNIPQDDIDDIRRGKSAMPDDVTKHLSVTELRDLMEFLAQQTKPDATVKGNGEPQPSSGHGKRP